MCQFGGMKQFHYMGKSMLPTFQPGQILYVRPGYTGIQEGDIVVYEGENGYVVHRVESVEAGKIETHGDNNIFADDSWIPQEKIVGLVKGVEWEGGVRQVQRGKKQLFLARSRWAWQRFINSLLPIMGIPYRWVKTRGWVKKIWHPTIVKVEVKTGDGFLEKYLYHGRVVATWQPQTSQFVYKHPFDLVISPPEKEH